MNAQAEMNAVAPAAAATNDLLDQIVEQSRVAKSGAEHARARDLISELVAQVLDGTVLMSHSLSATLDARVAEIDSLISAQLSEVMHTAPFQQLEQSWTGLHYLVGNSDTGTRLQIRMFNATKRELVKDFQSALEFDQSSMFKKIYEEEFGTFGGAPFAALLGDFAISRQPEDMYFVEQMSHIAAAAHAPFIASAAPELFGLESYGDLGKPRDLAKVFDTIEYAKWKAFRESEDARYVGLTLPRFLGACPSIRSTAPPWKASISSRRSTAATIKNTCGAMPRIRLAASSREPLPTMAGAPPSAASKAAAWWTTCPRIPSRRTRATWR